MPSIIILDPIFGHMVTKSLDRDTHNAGHFLLDFEQALSLVTQWVAAPTDTEVVRAMHASSDGIITALYMEGSIDISVWQRQAWPLRFSTATWPFDFTIYELA